MISGWHSSTDQTVWQLQSETDHGETGRNGYSRGLEHLAGLRNKKEDIPLWKHCLIQHNGQTVRLKMVCLKSFKTAFMRQINEGVAIACCEADICMNSKTEFHQPSIVRVSASLGNTNEEQTGLSPQGDGKGARSRGGRSRAARSRGGKGARSRGRVVSTWYHHTIHFIFN